MAYEIVPDGNGGEVFIDNSVKPQLVAEPVVNAAAPQSGGYTPQDIADVYEVLAPMAGDYANANIERAGQAQASYGPLAEAAMGGSRTAGIGNYTYNRLARPAVDTMRDDLIVQGYSDALNRQLSETLRQAQENYNRSSRRYSMNNSNKSGTGSNNGAWNGEYEEDKQEEEKPKGSDYNPDDYIKGGYDFYRYGNLPGITGKFPLNADTPTRSYSYEEYTYGVKDPFEKGKRWVEFLRSIGYTG